jgi:hypothetical protein
VGIKQHQWGGSSRLASRRVLATNRCRGKSSTSHSTRSNAVSNVAGRATPSGAAGCSPTIDSGTPDQARGRQWSCGSVPAPCPWGTTGGRKTKCAPGWPWAASTTPPQQMVGAIKAKKQAKPANTHCRQAANVRCISPDGQLSAVASQAIMPDSIPQSAGVDETIGAQDACAPITP